MIKEKEMESIQNDLIQQELTNKELIEQKLLRQFRCFKDFFSKLVLDVLAPHYSYNLKIKLEKDAVANLRFSLL